MRYALVSVFEKAGLEHFVRGLVDLGFGILSTGGTAKYLAEKGIPITSVSDYTGSPEIMDGRVKTLHPKIHGGILGRRDNPRDQTEMQREGIAPIDIVVVNLYPFIEKVREIEQAGKVTHEKLIESIDIGGPTMIRAAAKNSQYVLPVIDPADYEDVLSRLKTSLQTSTVDAAFRQRLACKVFQTMAHYDGEIARYFSLSEELLEADGSPKRLAPVEAIVLEEESRLRYGENPHQQAVLYRLQSGSKKSYVETLQGKELSYNNLLDIQGAIDLSLELAESVGNRNFAVIIKHSNPCGIAIRSTAQDAFLAAKACDPVSSFGGIISVNGIIDETLAASMLDQFIEVVICEEVTDEARAVFQKKKNVRLMVTKFAELSKIYRGAQSERWAGMSIRNFLDGMLVQTIDPPVRELTAAMIVSSQKPTDEQIRDAEFAWRVVKHVKSNTIVLTKGEQAIGIGAGQMSRVDAAKLAVNRACEHGHNVEGAVAASDAFLPFPDTLEFLNDAGVSVLVQPGGSIKDDDVKASAETRNMVLYFTGERHFRH